MTNNDESPRDLDPIELDLDAISASDFALWGLDEIAYVQAIIDDEGRRVAGIFAANGEHIGSAPDRDTAAAAAFQEGLLPVWVH